MKKILATILTTTVMASAAFAGSTMVSSGKESKAPIMPEPCDLYRANEFSIDLFGTYNVIGQGQQDLFGDHAFGGGIAANYFFTKNLGLGIEAQAWQTRGGGDNVEGSSALNLTFRFPIGCTGWAPYAYVGGGFVTNTDRRDNDDFGDVTRDGDDIFAEGHAGVGVAYRFTRNFGAFTDARYTIVDRANNNFIGMRTGVTFAF